MAEKPLSEMSADELQALSKALGQQISALRARRDEVVDAFAKRQKLDHAVEAVEAMSPEQQEALQEALRKVLEVKPAN